jgi:subtilisin family serine protease
MATLRRTVLVIWLIGTLCAGLPGIAGEPESAPPPPTTIGVLLAGAADARQVAADCAAEILHPVPGVDRAWLWRPRTPPASAAARAALLAAWRRHPGIVHAEWQYPRRHDARAQARLPGRLQWHLHNTGQAGGTPAADLRMADAWATGVSGQGVVVAIVDDGVDTLHPAFAGRYRHDLDRNFQAGPEDDGGPQQAADNHGTAVAGIIAAGWDSPCGAGVAPDADLLSIRLISAQTTDILEASALAHRRDAIDIYNCSWGPDQSNGLRLAAMGFFTRQSILQGIAEGRAGRGAIYVWAAGNSGESGANVNFDGYANSRHTIAVGAVDRHGRHAPWSVSGAALTVVAPSGDEAAGVLATDRLGPAGESPGACNSFFTGTSAAAPMLSGMIALLLQANPALTWRDVQHILIRTATQTDPEHPDWIINAAGFAFNDRYGAGLANAAAAVNLAARWQPLPPATTVARSQTPQTALPDAGSPVTFAFAVDADIRLEHVELVCAADHPDWGQLELELVSPAGTVSHLLPIHEDRVRLYSEWRMLSLRHWGESSQGVWMVRARDGVAGQTGRITGLELRLHGLPAASFPGLLAPPTVLTITPDAFPCRLSLPTLLAGLPPGADLLAARARHGALSVGAGLVVDYWPADNIAGPDEILLVLGDGGHGVAHVRVDLQFTDPPVRTRQGFQATAAGASLLLWDSKLYWRSTPPPVLVAGPDHGSLRFLNIDGEPTYTVYPGYSGGDQVVFEVARPPSYTRTWVWDITVVEGTWYPAALAIEHATHGADLGAAFTSLRDAFTLSAWILPLGWGDVGLSGYGRIFDKDAISLFLCGADNRYYPDASLVLFLDHASGAEAAATTDAGAIETGVWSHVLVTYDGVGEVGIYINGEARAVRPAIDIALPAGPLRDHADAVLMLGNTDAMRRPFHGRIAMPRVWGRALSAAEAVFVPAHDWSPLRDHLLGEWLIAEGIGDRLNNSTQLPAGSIRGGARAPRYPVVDRDALYFSDWHAAGAKTYFAPVGGHVAARHFPWLWFSAAGWSHAGPDTGAMLWLLDLEGAVPTWLAMPRAGAYRYAAATRRWYYPHDQWIDGHRWRYDFAAKGWESW